MKERGRITSFFHQFSRFLKSLSKAQVVSGAEQPIGRLRAIRYHCHVKFNQMRRPSSCIQTRQALTIRIPQYYPATTATTSMDLRTASNCNVSIRCFQTFNPNCCSMRLSIRFHWIHIIFRLKFGDEPASIMSRISVRAYVPHLSQLMILAYNRARKFSTDGR
jgi:hypothetical protein